MLPPGDQIGTPRTAIRASGRLGACRSPGVRRAGGCPSSACDAKLPGRAPGRWVRPYHGAAIGRHIGESSQEETECAVAMSPGRSLASMMRDPTPAAHRQAVGTRQGEFARRSSAPATSGLLRDGPAPWRPDIEAHITGTVWKIECQIGDTVAEGDTVVDPRVDEDGDAGRGRGRGHGQGDPLRGGPGRERGRHARRPASSAPTTSLPPQWRANCSSTRRWTASGG